VIENGGVRDAKPNFGGSGRGAWCGNLEQRTASVARMLFWISIDAGCSESGTLCEDI
jgi:hypothetical protein